VPSTHCTQPKASTGWLRLGVDVESCIARDMSGTHSKQGGTFVYVFLLSLTTLTNCSKTWLELDTLCHGLTYRYKEVSVCQESRIGSWGPEYIRVWPSPGSDLLIPGLHLRFWCQVLPKNKDITGRDPLKIQRYPYIAKYRYFTPNFGLSTRMVSLWWVYRSNAVSL
jgi:hypothetical protein